MSGTSHTVQVSGQYYFQRWILWKRYKKQNARIVTGKQAFGNKKRLLTGNMNLDLKKKIIKCTIWSVVLYEAKIWTMTQADTERLEAFEMWIWRRMLKISWVDKVSNAEVLQKVQENKSILDTVQHRKYRWIGHILRHDSLLCDIMEGWREKLEEEGNGYKC